MARSIRILSGILAATVAVAAASGQTFDVVTLFHGGAVSAVSALVQGLDGNLYGTTLGGGANGTGAVFKIDPNGNELRVLHSFSGSDGAYPAARLLATQDGFLYGTTSAGGATDSGTIFKVSTDGTSFTVLHSFDAFDGAAPYAGLIQATDGNLYGTTSERGNFSGGTIFRIDTNGTTLTTLHHFVAGLGAKPLAGLLQASDGHLYGTTYRGGGNDYGMVFKIDTAGTTFTPMHSFLGPVGSEGAHPRGDLIDGGDGFLYGTTETCGASVCDFNSPGHGTIFKIAKFDAAFTTLHSFDGTDGTSPYAGLLKGADGNFYGTTLTGGFLNGEYFWGTVFKLDAGDGTLTTLHYFDYYDSGGTLLQAGLVQTTDGNLYGTTFEGGANNYGTIFRIDTSGSTFTTVHDFVRDEGANPSGLIQGPDGFFYGTTFYGGTRTYGTIFRVDTGGAALTTLHSFDDERPGHGVILGADGRLYGTTDSSGPTSWGTIYRIDANGANFTTLHTFDGFDGTSPITIMRGADGYLYGTTRGGGALGYGTIFKIDSGGTTLTTLHDFDLSDGGNGASPIIQAADGKLYGTTSRGGAGDCIGDTCGTLFRLDTDGTNFETVHDFLLSEGAWPAGSLIQGADGNLYGTTTLGPLGFSGTIYKIDPDGVMLTTLHKFVPAEGPGQVLVQASDGNLYGAYTAPTGPCMGHGCGAIFRLDTNGTTFTTVHDFVFSEGMGPSALIQAADGALYGTTSSGGVGTPPGIGNGAGGVFNLSLCSLAQSPAVAAPHCIPPATPGHIASVTGNPADAYHWTVFGGTITGGQGTQSITFASGEAGTRLTVQVFETDSNGCVGSAAEYAQVDFDDVAPADPVYPYVCTIGQVGITAGCGSGDYCPTDPVRRDQMAVFLLKAKHDSSYVPPSCMGIFADVPCPGPFTDWVEELAAEGITAGCGSGNYCPANPVTRAQMAVFLLKAEHGSAYIPPACAGVFADVDCPSAYADWIEQLATENITAGCGGGNYCPDNANTRGQMAVFLAKTFQLP